MAKVRFRIRLAALDVIHPSGETHSVAWTDTFSIPQGTRPRPKVWFTSAKKSVTTRAAPVPRELADRLRIRQLRREIRDGTLDRVVRVKPSLAGAIFLILGVCALPAWLWGETSLTFSGASRDYAYFAYLPWWYLPVLLLGLAGCVAFWIVATTNCLWLGWRMLRPADGLRGVRFTSRGLLLVFSDDTESFHAWRDLKNAAPDGRLCIGGCSPTQVRLPQLQRAEWQLMVRALRRHFLAAPATDAVERRVVRRVIAWAVLGGVAADALVWRIQRDVGGDTLPGSMTMVMLGLLLACVLQSWLPLGAVRWWHGVKRRRRWRSPDERGPAVVPPICPRGSDGIPDARVVARASPAD